MIPSPVQLLFLFFFFFYSRNSCFLFWRAVMCWISWCLFSTTWMMPGLTSVNILYTNDSYLTQRLCIWLWFLAATVNVVFVASPCRSHAHRCVHFAAAEWGEEFRSASQQTVLSSRPDGHSGVHRHTRRPPHCSKGWFSCLYFFFVFFLHYTRDSLAYFGQWFHVTDSKFS